MVWSAIPTIVDNFYPRSPCGERLLPSLCSASAQTFLSTLSLRRATTILNNLVLHQFISIHALLAESDHGRHRVFCRALQFLSTLSLRRATFSVRFPRRYAHISIHALLAESDLSACWRGCWSRCISIHALLAESDGD